MALEKLQALEGKRDELVNEGQKIEDAISSIESVTLLPIPDISKQLAMLSKIEADLDAAEELASQIRCAIDDVSEYGHKVDGLASELSQVKKELDKIKVCSACGRPL